MAEENLELELDFEPLCDVGVMEGAAVDDPIEHCVVGSTAHLELAMRVLDLGTIDTQVLVIIRICIEYEYALLTNYAICICIKGS